MTTITVSPRKFKCTPFLISALSSEWMGKEVTPTVPQEDLEFEFETSEYAAGFEKSLGSYKL
jgi:hypothetical protein